MTHKKLMVLSVDGEQAARDKPVIKRWSSEINAIACGIEVKLNLVTGFSNIVTQRSIDIARQLDIPEKEIQRWTAARSMFDFEISRGVQSLLDLGEQQTHKGGLL